MQCRVFSACRWQLTNASTVKGWTTHVKRPAIRHTSKNIYCALLQGKDDVTGEPLIRRKDDTAETLRKRLASFSQQTTPVSCHHTSHSLQCVDQQPSVPCGGRMCPSPCCRQSEHVISEAALTLASHCGARHALVDREGWPAVAITATAWKSFICARCRSQMPCVATSQQEELTKIINKTFTVAKNIVVVV
jgi:hypothetical protein